MKLLLVALFTIGIGCSSACLVPLGCGNAVVEELNAIKPCVNIQGQNIIDELNEGVLQLRDLIEIEDIQGLSLTFENVGASGYINLATTTSDACLQQIFLSLAEVDSFVGYLLRYTSDPIDAAELVCNALSYKAQRVNSCSAAAPYIVLV